MTKIPTQTSFHCLNANVVVELKNSRAMQVSGVVGVINAAGLHQEVVTIVVIREKFYGSFGHLQNGRLIAFVALRQAVVVIAEVTRGKQTQHLAIAGSQRKAGICRNPQKGAAFMPGVSGHSVQSMCIFISHPHIAAVKNILHS